MRILYIAEIVGKPGLYCIKTLLSNLRQEKEIDFVIANGDAVTGGFGIGKNHAIYLRKLGVDVITGGDQTFLKKDMAEHIDRAFYMLRPANLPTEMPGRGWRHYAVEPSEWAALSDESPSVDGAGEEQPNNGGTDPRPEGSKTTAKGGDTKRPGVKISVLSLLGQSGFARIHAGNPYTYFDNVLERISKDSVAVIVDFHALTTAEKYTMFHHVDGKATAVIGSGQRVQTADAQVFPSGTAVICDAGRTGSQRSVGGMTASPEIKKYLTRIPIKSEESWDALELQGTILDIDLASGYVVGFEALRKECPPPPPEERQRARERSGSRASGRKDTRRDSLRHDRRNHKGGVDRPATAGAPPANKGERGPKTAEPETDG